MSLVKTTKVDVTVSKDSSINQVEKEVNEIVEPNRDNPLDILNTIEKDDKIDIKDQDNERD